MSQQVATIQDDGNAVAAPETGNAITPMQMLQIAVEKGADLDQMQKLMDLQERWEATEARKAFVAALNDFKADPPSIVKDREINHGNKLIAKYAGLDQVSRVVGEALSKHGISHRWDTEQTDGEIRVTCILTHDLGHSERTTLKAAADGSGSKNSIQAIGSTVTYLQRYTLLAATGLSAGEADDDGATALDAKIDDAQKAELVELLKRANVNTPSLLERLGLDVESLDDMPAVMFTMAKQMLQARIQKNAAEKGGDA